LAIEWQVKQLNEVLPVRFWRHGLDAAAEAIERKAVNAGEEAAFAPLGVGEW
jgi:hypothetical protein